MAEPNVHSLAHVVFPGVFEATASDRLGRTERHGRARGADSRGVVREVRDGGVTGARAEFVANVRVARPTEPMGASGPRARPRDAVSENLFPVSKNLFKNF